MNDKLKKYGAHVVHVQAKSKKKEKESPNKYYNLQ